MTLETLRERVEKRVLHACNAAIQNADGTAKWPSAAIAQSDIGDDAYAVEYIRIGVTQAGVQLLRMILKDKNNKHRLGFGVDTVITHGARIPECVDYGTPVIRKFSTDRYEAADFSKSVQEIEDYRTNALNIYSAVAHDTASPAGFASPISGYCQIVDDKVFFTGYDCKIPLYNFEQADVDNRIPDDYEDTWYKLSVSLMKKKGDGGWLTGIFNQLGSEGIADLKVPPSEAQRAPDDEGDD